MAHKGSAFFLLAPVFRGFVIHQPLIVVLLLFDAENTSNGVHGNKGTTRNEIQNKFQKKIKNYL